jgi:predicted transcriptional regulator
MARDELEVIRDVLLTLRMSSKPLCRNKIMQIANLNGNTFAKVIKILEDSNLVKKQIIYTNYCEKILFIISTDGSKFIAEFEALTKRLIR